MKSGLFAALILFAALPGHAASSASTLQGEVRALLRGKPSLQELYRQKRAIGDERFAALRDEVGKEIFHPPEGFHQGAPVIGCIMDTEGSRLHAAMGLVAAAADDGQWRVMLDEAQDALRRRDAIRETILERGEPLAEFPVSSHLVLIARSTKDAWLRELARRATRDQFVREALPGTRAAHWAEGVSPPVSDYLQQLGGADMCETDLDNSAWLKSQLRRHGWPRISRAGKEADAEAFHIVNHADHDVAWQAEVLADLAPLVPIRETDPTDYAVLFDRIAVKRGELQRYGTRGRCTEPGRWRSFDNEPGDLDARRASVSLPPEAQSEAQMVPFCSGPPQPAQSK
jgi:hypothetical protein